MINMALAAQQKITDEGIEKLNALYKVLDEVISRPEYFDNPVRQIEQLEFKLQKLWKFPQDARYHTHWVKIKGCTCPKMDNKNFFGSDICLVNQTCPWHSPSKHNA